MVLVKKNKTKKTWRSVHAACGRMYFNGGMLERHPGSVSGVVCNKTNKELKTVSSIGELHDRFRNLATC